MSSHNIPFSLLKKENHPYTVYTNTNQNYWQLTTNDVVSFEQLEHEHNQLNRVCNFCVSGALFFF